MSIRRQRSARRVTSGRSFLLVLLFFCSFFVQRSGAVLPTEPQLDGVNFRVTVVEEQGFLDFHTDPEDGSLTFSGYCIDLLEAIARPDRANFTFELVPPSGTGSLCEPVLDPTNNPLDQKRLFDPVYYTQYNCGQSDVTDLPASNYTTDLYLSLFYITPERQRVGQFSQAFTPPYSGRNIMLGTAVNVYNVSHLVELQKEGKQKPVCMPTGYANTEYVQRAFPQIEIVSVMGTDAALYEALNSGLCEVVIIDHPIASHFVLERSRNNECDANGFPIGLIGEPFSFGLDHYGIGIHGDIPVEVVRTINYWLNTLMSCAPADPGSACPNGQGSLESLYSDYGARGDECGYVQFPAEGQNDRRLGTWGIVGTVLGCVALVAIIVRLVVVSRLREQRKRIRKRFVQQIARNIAIGPSPGSIPPDKLAEQVQHIGDSHGVILKEDLRQWMADVKLEFISESDFNALWAAMDVDGTGKVDAVEFFIFLSSCGPQFEEVYNEEQNMPRMERLKLAARRLSVINSTGEAGVKRIEHELERTSRTAPNPLGELNGEATYSDEMRREVERAARSFGFRNPSGKSQRTLSNMSKRSSSGKSRLKTSAKSRQLSADLSETSATDVR